MSAKLRATLFNLAMAATAYYIIHHRTIEASDLNVQNFCVSVHFCTENFATPAKELVQLLCVGIEILEEDESACTGNMMAALSHARMVLAVCAPETERTSV